MAIVVPSLHPAAILRGAGGDDSSGLAKYLHVIKGDFARAASLRYRKPSWDESAIWRETPHVDGQWRFCSLFPRSVEEIHDFCRAAEGLPLSVDVECSGNSALSCDLICVGMASASGQVLNVPFMVGGKDHVGRYWTRSDENRVKEALSWLFLDHRTPKWGQNIISFDSTVTWAHGMPMLGIEHDLMQLGHCYDGEMPQNLGYLASRCPTTEVPYWKDIGTKGATSWLDVDPLTLRSYCLRDALVVLRAVPWYLEQIRELKLERLYRAEIKQCHIMRKATWRGIEVDLDRRDSSEIVDEALLTDKAKARRLGVSEKDRGLHVGLGPRMEKVQRENLAVLREIAGHADFNPNSHDQLTWFLYDHLKFPVVLRSPKTNRPSTDKNAMVLLALHAESDKQKAALMALVRVRKANKMIGTWVRGLPMLGDGRLHAAWKLLPISGRFASSPNLQNFNLWIKKIFCSQRERDAHGKLVRDKHGNYVFTHDFVSVDLNQAELRKIAYFASDGDLLRMYEENINVHTANTALLFGIRCPAQANKKGDQLNPQTEKYLREKFTELRASGIDLAEWFEQDYDDLPTFEGDDTFVKERWKSIRTLSKIEVFSGNYGAVPDTQLDQVRSKRDPNTDETLFGDVTISDIELFQRLWGTLHPRIEWYQGAIAEHIQSHGYYRSPLSGRIIWFRGGFERNKMYSLPIQEAVAAHMERMIEVNEYLEQLSGGSELSAGADHPIIDLHVHDSITIESPKRYTEDCREILSYVFNKPYDWDPPAPFTKHLGAVLPAGDIDVGNFLNEV